MATTPLFIAMLRELIININVRDFPRKFGTLICLFIYSIKPILNGILQVYTCRTSVPQVISTEVSKIICNLLLETLRSVKSCDMVKY